MCVIEKSTVWSSSRPRIRWRWWPISCIAYTYVRNVYRYSYVILYTWRNFNAASFVTYLILVNAARIQTNVHIQMYVPVMSQCVRSSAPFIPPRVRAHTIMPEPTNHTKRIFFFSISSFWLIRQLKKNVYALMMAYQIFDFKLTHFTNSLNCWKQEQVIDQQQYFDMVKECNNCLKHVFSLIHLQFKVAVEWNTLNAFWLSI